MWRWVRGEGIGVFGLDAETTLLLVPVIDAIFVLDLKLVTCVTWEKPAENLTADS